MVLYMTPKTNTDMATIHIYVTDKSTDKCVSAVTVRGKRVSDKQARDWGYAPGDVLYYVSQSEYGKGYVIFQNNGVTETAGLSGVPHINEYSTRTRCKF